MFGFERNSRFGKLTTITIELFPKKYWSTNNKKKNIIKITKINEWNESKRKSKTVSLVMDFYVFLFHCKQQLQLFVAFFISGFPVSIDLKVVVVFIDLILSQIVITLSKMYNPLVNIELILHIFDAQRVVTVWNFACSYIA